METKLKEKDLYKPIKKAFMKRGYKVNAEVNGCDMTAHKDDELIVIELKKTFNMKLLYQAIDRQKITNLVYIAIPRPSKTQRKNFNTIIHIVKKLNLGLIIVAIDSQVKKVDIVVTPEESKSKKNKRNSKMIKEINGRNLDINEGGSNKVKLVTAFRERCIHIACVMEIVDLISPSQLVKEYGCGKDAGEILRKNFYGWFVRESRGLYKLSNKGKKDLNSTEFIDIINFYRHKLK